ncbi:MAG: CBS domain-containing protein [Gemmatimonas sp.]
MQAKDLMTRDVVSVTPDTPAHEVARVLLDHAISAVPVVDSGGSPVGMISEGDLIARGDSDRDSRRDWWLALLAEGQQLNPEFLASLRRGNDTARHLMAAPVVTVEETTEASEIARLLAQYRIKRVPVVRDGRVVGIVSRADLLRALAAEPAAAGEPRKNGGFLAEAIREIEHRVGLGQDDEGRAATGSPAPSPRADETVDASAFRAATEHAEMEDVRRRHAERRRAEQRRHAKLQELIDRHIENTTWSDLLHQAKQAAERGETEFLLLRFPSELCSDAGRAINVGEPEWPATLRGEAAEMYLRWEHQLKPHGFHLSAQVLDFPNGVPGDIGLTLSWKE